MARQCGTYCITGTKDHLCFYQMEGKYYVRTKSSLSAKRVKQDPAFKITMQYAGLLGAASKIASKLYSLLPKEERVPGLYRRLTGKVMQLLKAGSTEDEILALLQKPAKTFSSKQSRAIKIQKPLNRREYADAVIAQVFEDLITEAVAEGLWCVHEAPT